MTQTAEDFAPDFFIVGAAKAGTTALYHWLSDHPDVFLPIVKEPGYFAHAGGPAAPLAGPYDPAYTARIATDAAAYAALYADAGTRQTGDVSPVYLLCDRAARRIATARPDARIVIVLRDPVYRAFSQYMHHVRDSLDPCPTFDAALAEEDERLRAGWSWGHGYATHGHYLAQVERYLAAFPRHQILFLDYDTLQSAPDHCWFAVCDHLGLAHRPLLRNDRVNATAGLATVSARPGLTRRLRHPGAVQSLLKRAMPKSVRTRIRAMIEGAGRPAPTLSDGTRRALARRYASERPALEAATGLTLSHWTRPDTA